MNERSLAVRARCAVINDELALDVKAHVERAEPLVGARRKCCVAVQEELVRLGHFKLPPEEVVDFGKFFAPTDDELVLFHYGGAADRTRGTSHSSIGPCVAGAAGSSRRCSAQRAAAADRSDGDRAKPILLDLLSVRPRRLQDNDLLEYSYHFFAPMHHKA